MTKLIMETGEHLSRKKKKTITIITFRYAMPQYARKHDQNCVCGRFDDAPPGLIYYIFFILCVYTNAAGSQKLTLQTSIHLKCERRFRVLPIHHHYLPALIFDDNSDSMRVLV